MNKLIPTQFLFFLLLVSQPLFSQSLKKIVVAKDGSGNFPSIQEAVNSVNNANGDNVTIIIKNGVYKEKLIIPKSKHNIIFKGENKNNTIITFDDYSGKTDPITNEKHGTFSSHSVLVVGNHVEFLNVTIENSSCNQGQAVALHVEGDQFLIKNSNIIGCQDTVFTGGENSHQYYLDCYIEGTTDFIFGPATAVFKDCTIKSKKDSYITAASTPENQDFGYVFFNCNLIASNNVTKVFLGRPWRPYAKTVFIKCQLGEHIVPEGWNPWLDKRFPNKDKTAYYAEYKNKGKGSHTSNRVSWSHQLSKKEATIYTLEHIFKGSKFWKP